MFFQLLKLEWKSFFRSASLGKGIGVKMLLGFLGLYFFVVFLLLGFGLYSILRELFPNDKPLLAVNNILLFWFFAEFIIRGLLQNLPTADVKALLVQSISRNKIIHSLLFKTFYSFYNLLSLAVVIPFVIVNFKRVDYSSVQVIAWFIAAFGMVYIMNFLNIWVQRHFFKGIKTLVPFVLIILILYVLEYTGVYSISHAFGQLFSLTLVYPVLGLIPLLIAVFMYQLVFKDLKRNLYLDSYLNTGGNNIQSSDLTWLDRFGALAPFIKLDIRLIARNKRAKNATLLCFLFLFYGVIFYNNDSFGGSKLIFVFVGIFMTGIFVINYGQFIPAWDSSYFSIFRTQPITMTNYLLSKVWLMYISIIILTLLSTFYAYYGWDKVYLNYACAVYNLGVNIPIILLFSTMNRKRIDLANKSMFNYQGIGVAQWLVGIPLILVPVVIWGAVEFVFSVNTANTVLVVLGVIGLIFHKVIIAVVAKMYIENRYKILEGFKQKD